jgi:hypothetical protein
LNKLRIMAIKEKDDWCFVRIALLLQSGTFPKDEEAHPRPPHLDIHSYFLDKWSFGLHKGLSLKQIPPGHWNRKWSGMKDPLKTGVVHKTSQSWSK